MNKAGCLLNIPLYTITGDFKLNNQDLTEVQTVIQGFSQSPRFFSNLTD